MIFISLRGLNFTFSQIVSLTMSQFTFSRSDIFFSSTTKDEPKQWPRSIETVQLETPDIVKRLQLLNALEKFKDKFSHNLEIREKAEKSGRLAYVRECLKVYNVPFSYIEMQRIKDRRVEAEQSGRLTYVRECLKINSFKQ